MVKQNWGAHLLLINSQKKFLLQLRDSKATKYPNYWSLFGGRIEENETPKDALEREILEEINYKCRNHKFKNS